MVNIMTPEDIEQGLRDLGLSDEKTRQSLNVLLHLTPSKKIPKYETITETHTFIESKEVCNAKLESSS